MKFRTKSLLAVAVLATFVAGPALAAVTAEEAARLKADLTPIGAERAGNKDGTIPEWTGGMTTPTPGFKNGGRRPDPFADEKPIAQITAKNMDQYADKLTDGVKFMLKKYPETYRLDVYQTHRTAAMPQWVYDNTFANATRATVEDDDGLVPKGAYGGFPFPIPKTGAELMFNAQVRWRGTAWRDPANLWQVPEDGNPVLVSSVDVINYSPYYVKDGSVDNFNGGYWWVVVSNTAPPLRAGEKVLATQNLDEKNTLSWIYLVGQRRVRKLPNPCCDTPNPAVAGILTFDEQTTWGGRLDRFDWKIIGKKEIYIPYNSNRSLVPKDDKDIVHPHHLNPDYVRWELHRVWVVEADLKPGARNISPKVVIYVDEDTWWPMLSDRWDANGQLWRMTYTIPVAMPDLPGQVGTSWGAYNLLTGGYFNSAMYNSKDKQFEVLNPPPSEAIFSPDALAGEGVR